MIYQTPQKSKIGTSRIVAVYALFGLAWIYGSDTVMGWLVHDPAVMVKIAVIKGSLFILLTSALLYTLISRFTKQLATSERRYQTIFNTAMDGFWLVNEQGRLLDVNEAYCHMSGYRKQELLSMSIADFDVSETVDDAINHNKKIMEQGIDRFVAQHRRKDGSVFDVEVSSKFIPVDGGLIVGFIRDITEHNRAEKALQESEVRFRSYVENANDIVFSLSTEGVFTYVSPNWKDAFGYELDETVGKSFAPFVHPDDIATCVAFLQKVLETGEKLTNVEYRVICKDGTLSWYSANGSCLRDAESDHVSFLGIGRDINERKHAEKSLKEGKDLLAEIIEVSPISMAIINMDGTVEQINCRAIETFGYSPDDIPNMERWWVQAYPDESYRTEVIAQWMGLVGKAIAEKREIERREYRVTCKDGTVKTTLIFGIPVSDKVFVMFDDITERKRAEADRLALERQLLQAQKMESLGILAGGIAHDFNNILTSIVGNIELALMRLNPESPVLDNLKQIEKNAVRATDLAKQMLAYSGKGNFVIEAIDINRLVQEMGHMLDVSISKKATLRYNLAQPLPSVEVDATQIRQVVMNLVINASEALGEMNGVIAITTGCMDCDKNFINNVVLDKSIKAGRYVYLEIADTGCGMNKETLTKVFDPFFTTKFTGRGLGMAAVLGIVRGHKGFINVYSEPDKGTTFKFFLPASDQVVAPEVDQTQQEDWKGEGKVLLVDDEETVRDIGKEMLQELGFSVITANDGNEAIEMFKTIPEISFVILDLTMPKMDGEECFGKLKQLKSDLKVVISSGFSEQEVSQKFAGRGLAGFIQKPYKLSVLKEAIHNI